MKIITVFKTHFDIGFTHLAEEVIKNYSSIMLKDVLKACEKTQQLGKELEYKWTMSSWPLVQMLKNATKEDRQRAEELIKRGQLVWHALPFTTHTEFCSPEELIRGLHFAKDLSDKYNKPYPVSGKMTDVPGHTRYLVSLLAKAGVKFLHLGCNPASTPPEVPLLFWWENTDGERVLTFYNKKYGSELLPPKDWKFPVWLFMNQTNDNIGPHGPEVIEEMIASLESKAELSVGTLDDFYHELNKYDLSSLPVVKGDLADSWIHGVGTYPLEVAALRKYRKELISAEKSYCNLTERNIEIEKLISEAYDNALLFGEHTWGLDVKTHLGFNRVFKKKEFLTEKETLRYKYMEQSWDEQRQRVVNIGKSLKKIQNLLCDKLLKEENKKQLKSNLRLSVENNEVKILDKEENVVLSGGNLFYTVAGIDQLTEFQRAYLTRFHVWAIYDFGRIDYPEIDKKEFSPERIEIIENADGITAIQHFGREAYEQYGMAKSVSVHYTKTEKGILITVKMEKPATPFIESADFALVPRTKNISINKTGGMVNPQKDIVSKANHVAYCMENFVDCNDGTLAISSISSPLVSQGEDLLFKYRNNYNPELKKDLYFNLFNNMWGTNFPQWIEGNLTYEFLVTEHQQGNLSELFEEGIDEGLKTQNAVIYSVKRTKDGKIVRLRETDGKEVTTLLFPVSKAFETDHFERKGKELAVKDGKVSLMLKPYEIKSILITN